MTSWDDDAADDAFANRDDGDDGNDSSIDMDDIRSLSDDGFSAMMTHGGVHDERDDLGLPLLINDSGTPTVDGLVFLGLPREPVDVDLATYFPIDVVEAAIAAHENHYANPRRLFEDIERVAKWEDEQARVAERRRRRTRTQGDGSMVASPSFLLTASPLADQSFASPDAAVSAGTGGADGRTGSLGRSMSLFSSPLFGSQAFGGLGSSLRRPSEARAGSAIQSVANDDAESTASTDSMEEWRRTVVVPPRSPTPPPPIEPTVKIDATPLSCFLPSLQSAIALKRVAANSDAARGTGGVAATSLPLVTLSAAEVLYGNRLLAQLRAGDVDALTSTGVVERLRLPVGTVLCREGQPNFASHTLVLIDGCVTESRRNVTLLRHTAQCSLFFEADCVSEEGGTVNLSTVTVTSPGGAGFWAVPRAVVQRIQQAVNSQRRAAYRRAVSSGEAQM